MHHCRLRVMDAPEESSHFGTARVKSEIKYIVAFLMLTNR